MTGNATTRITRRAFLRGAAGSAAGEAAEAGEVRHDDRLDMPAEIDGSRLISRNAFGRTLMIRDLSSREWIFPCEPMCEAERAHDARMRAENPEYRRTDLAQQASDFREVARLALIAADATETISRQVTVENFDRIASDCSYRDDGRREAFTFYHSDPDCFDGWEGAGPLAEALLEILRDQTLTILARNLSEEVGPLAAIAARARAETGEAPERDEAGHD
ncbi:hypothetical protein [Stappia sp. ICDLI1TA098]